MTGRGVALLIAGGLLLLVFVVPVATKLLYYYVAYQTASAGVDTFKDMLQKPMDGQAGKWVGYPRPQVDTPAREPPRGKNRQEIRQGRPDERQMFDPRRVERDRVFPERHLDRRLGEEDPRPRQRQGRPRQRRNDGGRDG